MSEQFIQKLEALKRRVVLMGAMVEEAIDEATMALMQRSLTRAQRVIEDDKTIDEEEVAIEKLCFELSCLQGPVAEDARFILTALKVNNDLERMGDLAVNIAERAAYLSTHDPLQLPETLAEMADEVRKMVRDSLDSLVSRNAPLAMQVWEMDDQVDLMNAEMYVSIQALMAKQPATIERALHLLSVSRHLERIADLATNIAEDVIFLVEGKIVRQQVEDYVAGTANRRKN